MQRIFRTLVLALFALCAVFLSSIAAANVIRSGAAFHHYINHHPKTIKRECGAHPSGLVSWHHGVGTQRWPHCTMIAVITICQNAPKPTSTATPPSRPTNTPTPLPPTVTPVPPTATPTPWPTPYIPAPTVAPIPTGNSAATVLALLNADRRANGVFTPLSLDSTQSAQALIHSEDMAATGSIWHVDPRYPSASFPAEIIVPYSSAGENVGEGYSVAQLDALMMSEQHDPSYCSLYGNHACNIINGRFRSVGIGVYTDPAGTIWLTEDLVGP